MLNNAAKPSLPRPLVRSALSRLVPGNQAKLGSHPFAAYLGHLPEAQRGPALQDALQRAIWATRPTADPEAKPVWTNRHWRKFLILTEQYGRGRPPEVVAQALFISPANYYRDQAAAVEEVALQLAELLKVNQPGPTTEDGPLPRLHTAPPRNQQAIFGRAGLLADIKAQLMAGQDVAVFGLPGVGKSTLLSALAYDATLLAQFAEGVLWAGLGPHADVLVRPSQEIEFKK